MILNIEVITGGVPKRIDHPGDVSEIIREIAADTTGAVGDREGSCGVVCVVARIGASVTILVHQPALGIVGKELAGAVGQGNRGDGVRWHPSR